MSVALMLLPKLTEIHDQFLSLTRVDREHFADSLGGKLLLRSGFDVDGIAAVVAASIAGAASLSVDADAERLRQGLRAGLCDFVVGHLDEALRILKNELRQARPVSVGLAADPAPCIGEMIERGLQPDLLSALAEGQARIFIERGAIALPADEPHPDTSLIEWTVATDPAKLMPRIARIVSGSLDSARRDTLARRRWLDQSPRYLGRAFASRQCLRAMDAEIAALLPLVHAEIPSAAITRDGEKR
jgi:hypothetical protein